MYDTGTEENDTSKRLRLKNSDLEFLDLKGEQVKKILNSTKKNSTSESKKKYLLDNNKNYNDNDDFNSIIFRNLNNNIISNNNLYKEIKRPNHKIFDNINSRNVNNFAPGKIQNFDIIAHTENSFVNPETEMEINISKFDNAEKSIEKINKFNVSHQSIDDKNLKNEKDIKITNVKINYRFQSPTDNQINTNSYDQKEKKIIFNKNYILKKNENWDSVSCFDKQAKKSDKISNSMNSSLSYKTNFEKKNHQNLNSGIIDLDFVQIQSTKTKLENQNIHSESKENETVNFISSVKHNEKFNNIAIENTNVTHKKDLYLQNNQENSINEIMNYSQNKNFDQTNEFEKSIIIKNHSADINKDHNTINKNNDNLSSFMYNNDFSNIIVDDALGNYPNNTTDKQITNDYLVDENKIKNYMLNKKYLSNINDISPIRINKSGLQGFVQLNKIDINRNIHNQILKNASMKKDNVNQSKVNISRTNENQSILKQSKSNVRLIDLSKLEEKHEYINKIPSPDNKKRNSGKNLTISKNSLYMEKVLFYVDNYQKDIPVKKANFEEEYQIIKPIEEEGFEKFEKKFLIPPNYMNLKSNEIIEKNKSFKILEKNDGKVKLFEVFSAETLENFNRDKLMVNDLDLKNKYFDKNYLLRNNSFNLYRKNNKIKINSNKPLNNSHQINLSNNTYNNYNINGIKRYNYNKFNTSNNYPKLLNSEEEQKENKINNFKRFTLQPKIYLREDKNKFDYTELKDEEESENINEVIKTPLIAKNNRGINKSENDKENSFKKLKENSFNNENLLKLKTSPLILSASNMINTRNIIENYEYDNQHINQGNNLNKSNYSQDLKNFQNEYWIKRRSEPYKFNNNSSYDMYLNNSSINNDKSRSKLKDNLFRSSQLEFEKALLQKNQYDLLKMINNRNVENVRENKKIEFKKDVIFNRKKMDIIEGSIQRMVVEATYKARDDLENFMYNSTKEQFITIEKDLLDDKKIKNEEEPVENIQIKEKDENKLEENIQNIPKEQQDI